MREVLCAAAGFGCGNRAFRPPEGLLFNACALRMKALNGGTKPVRRGNPVSFTGSIQMAKSKFERNKPHVNIGT
ncbi:MAG: hypothetical protein QUV26_21245, partial [Rhizobium sp.]|nr:hypothetical protein [Rhizobium sp.]